MVITIDRIGIEFTDDEIKKFLKNNGYHLVNYKTKTENLSVDTIVALKSPKDDLSNQVLSRFFYKNVFENEIRSKMYNMLKQSLLDYTYERNEKINSLLLINQK